MKKATRIIILLIISFFSFLIFFYASFPFQILKETISVQASQATGFTVTMKKLMPKFPLGLSVVDAAVSKPGQGMLSLKQVDAGVSLLSLLLMRLNLHSQISDATGFLDLETTLGLPGLLSGAVTPSYLRVHSKDFQLKDIVKFLIVSKANSPGTSPLIKPVLEKIGLEGLLQTEIELHIDKSDVQDSAGGISISLEKAALKFDPGMHIPDQVFEKAMIKGVLKNGTLVMDKKSQIVSKDLAVNIAGKFAQNNDFAKSLLDLEIDIEISGGLKDQFGFVLGAITNGNNSGKFKIKVSGAVAAPQVQML